MRVTIVRLDDDGRGVGQAGDREVHVAGALPGETVEATIEHDSPHGPVSWASLVAVEGAPSADRVAPRCPGHGRCGGCALQHLAYPAQLALKRERVVRALAPLGIAVDEVVASPSEYGYRNKGKYVLGAGAGASGRLVYGSYAPGTHDLVPMRGCQVPEAPIDEIAACAVDLLEKTRLAAYDERQLTGELRYLVIRASDEGRVLVVLVTRTDTGLPALRHFAAALLRARPEVAGVVLDVNPTRGGAIFSSNEEVTILAGAGTLADTVGPIRLELSARAFFQVNRAQAARLYAAAAAAAGPGRVVDLYCGVGGIALTAAAAGAHVVGIESLPAAITDAQRSAAAAGLTARTHFHLADAATGLPFAAQHLGGLDAVIVDPPRKGLSAATRATLLALHPPRIIYVSCAPESLGRDLAQLIPAGYRIDRVTPYDLLPGTPHIETLGTVLTCLPFFTNH